MKKLTKEQQIEVVKEVRLRLNNATNMGQVFLCISFANVLRYKFRIRIDTDEVVDYIPLFTKLKAINMCRQHKITKPNGCDVWWNYEDDTIPYNPKMITTRDKYLGVLIQEIKKQ